MRIGHTSNYTGGDTNVGDTRAKILWPWMKTTTKSQKWWLRHKPLRFLESWTLAGVLVTASVLATGCGGPGSSSSGPGTPPGPLTVSLSTSTVVAPQDGTPGTVDVAVSGADAASSVSVATSNLPSGVISPRLSRASKDGCSTQKDVRLGTDP